MSNIENKYLLETSVPAGDGVRKFFIDQVGVTWDLMPDFDPKKWAESWSEIAGREVTPPRMIDCTKTITTQERMDAVSEKIVQNLAKAE
jgi:hypothetical protein